jgi:predicted dehydrogenase
MDSLRSSIDTRLGDVAVTSIDLARDPSPPTDCDAVLFLGHEPAAIQQMEQCLRERKHVLQNVGVGLTVDRLRNLSAVARQSGAQLAVMNPDHFLPSRKLIRQQLDAGKLGTPGFIRFHRWKSEDIPAEERSAELPVQLLRDLELTLSWMRASPNLVYAVELPADGPQTAGRLLQLHLGFSGGSMALIDYAERMPAGADYVSVSVIGAAGAAYADDQQNMQLVYRGGQPVAIRAEEAGLQVVAMVQDFVAGLQTNRDFTTSHTAWIGVLKVAESVRQSLATRRAVQITD